MFILLGDQQRSSPRLHLSITQFNNHYSATEDTTPGPPQVRAALPRQMNMYKSTRCVSEETDPMSRFNLECIRFCIAGAKFDLASIGFNSSGIKTWKKPTQSTGASQTDASWDGGACAGSV